MAVVTVYLIVHLHSEKSAFIGFCRVLHYWKCITQIQFQRIGEGTLYDCSL
jgi:hypothetical protein